MMAALPCIEQEINILIMEIENIFPSIETYCVNLVGSMSREYTIAKEILNIHDIDIFVNTLDNPELFCSCLVNSLRGSGCPTYRYIDELGLWGFKKIRKGICFSFHIVPFAKIKEIISRHDNPLTYDISLVGFKLNYTTVYRAWVMEAVCIGGNKAILNGLKFALQGRCIPANCSAWLRKRILQYLSYAKELNEDGKFAIRIVKDQLLEKIISLIYVENNMYYGTLKSLDGDLRSFGRARRLISLCNELYKNGNAKSNKDLFDSIERVILHEAL